MNINNLSEFASGKKAGFLTLPMSGTSNNRPSRSSLAAGLIFLLSALSILSACAEIAPPETPVAVDVCLAATSMNNAGIHYAQEKGLFAKHGLDANVVIVEGGPDAARALLSDQVDICTIAGPAVVNADLAGADMVIIGGIINRQLYSLMVLPEIQSAADLVGTSLAVSEPGSGSDSVLRFGLESLGLDPENDVSIVSVGGTSARVAAMEAGSVAGTVVNAPQSGRAKALGFSVLLAPEDMDLPYQHNSVVVSKEFLEENRPVVVSFIKALSEATFLMKQDRQGTLDLMSGVLLLDPEQDKALLDEAYEVIVLENMDERLPVNRAGVEQQIESGRQDNPTAVELSVDDVVDESIVNALQEEGFFDQLGE